MKTHKEWQRRPVHSPLNSVRVPTTNFPAIHFNINLPYMYLSTKRYFHDTLLPKLRTRDT